MKIAILSDTHFECGARRSVAPIFDAPDVFVCAGDIHEGSAGLPWLNNLGAPVIYVPGNHEFYGYTIQELIAELDALASQFPNVHLLINHSIDLMVRGQAVRFVGTPLWSAINTKDPFDMHAITDIVSDFGYIADYDIHVHRDLHRDAVRFLEQEIRRGKDSVSRCIVTHFAPHKGSVAPEFAKSALNPYYFTDMSRLFRPGDLWIHGHNHTPFDYCVGDTRIICNPLGYAGENSGASGFKLIEW